MNTHEISNQSLEEYIEQINFILRVDLQKCVKPISKISKYILIKKKTKKTQA